MKVVRIILVIVLVLFPYSTILSEFSPYWTSHTFQDFLLASLVYALAIIVLGWIISPGKMFLNKGVLFFLMGIFTGPPLMLGPPEETAKLLERTSEEHFRYGMLIVATLFFAAGFISILKNIWKDLSVFNKLVFIPFVICVALLIWDNISSYNLFSELITWTGRGGHADDFFSSYNYHEFFRTTGRSLVYLIILWLGLILIKHGLIKKWQYAVLAVFSLVGIAFYFLFNFSGPQYYFPFMVPAIALAPAYWLGLIFVSKK